MNIKPVTLLLVVIAGIAVAIWLAWSIFAGNTATDIHLHDTYSR